MKKYLIGFSILAAFSIITALIIFRSDKPSTHQPRAIVEDEQKIKQAESRAKEAEIRAKAADADTAQLLAAVESASKAQATGKGPMIQVTRAMLDAKLRHAKELRRAGDLKGALEELKWIFEDGSRSVPMYFAGRNYLVLPEIAELAKTYPAARLFLEQTGAKAAERFSADSNDSDSLSLFIQVSRELNDTSTIFRFVDQLTPDDPRRVAVTRRASAEFIALQRYAEVTNVTGIEEMMKSLARWSITPDFSKAPNPEVAVTGHRNAAISSTVKNIEALIGSGRRIEAVALTTKLLQYDSKPETIALIQKHALRAGALDFPISLPSNPSP